MFTPEFSRFASFLLLCLPLVGNAQTVEERLARLEEAFQALRAENTELRRQLGQPAEVAAPKGPSSVVPVPGGKVTRLAIGGFLQGQAEFGGAGDPRFVGINDRFYFRRARIYLAGSFAEHFEFKSELDLQGNSLGAGTGLMARANEIYIGWNRYPGATVRFGQLKPAFGAQQLMSDTVMPTIERYLGSDRLTDGRQLGLSLAGVTADNRLGYVAAIGNGSGSNVSANDNSKFLTSVRGYAMVADGPASGGLTLGVNAFHSDDAGVTKAGLGLDFVPGGPIDNLFHGSRMGWGGDVAWQRERMSLSAEYLQVRFQPRNAVPTASFNASAWHVTAGWFAVPEKLQAVVRHEAFDPRHRIDGDATNSWTLGLNYFIKGNDIKFQVNYLLGDSPLLPGDSGRLLSRIQIIY
ncbi:MAG: hypothetical protein KIT44_06720 [Opitutaceae bacterium]|nr:hypothetical protein [Opitutaceae bacterium]